MGCLTSERAQPLINFVMDISFLLLARRDGSDGTGIVEPSALVAEIAAFLGDVANDFEIFEDLMHEVQ